MNKWQIFFIVIIGMSAFYYLTTNSANNTIQESNNGTINYNNAQISGKEIKVIVSTQGTDGVTQKDLNLQFLTNLETYTVGRLKLKTEKYLESLGYTNPTVNLTSEATYVEIGGVKLAIIRIHGGEDKLAVVFVSGIVGNAYKRVGCISRSIKTIPVTSGKCGMKIEEVFDVDFGA